MGKRAREKRERWLAKQGQTEEKGKIFLQTDLKKVCFFIIQWGTYLVLFTPLIISGKFFFPFVGPKSLYFMGLVEVIFFSWLILAIYFPQYRPRLNYLNIALILFLFVLILNTVFGENPSYSFWSKPERMTGLLMWFHLLAFSLVISSVFQNFDWQKIFAISIFVAVILSFITFFSDNPAMKGGATIGNDSFLGTYLIFNLFFALYLIFISKKELRIYSGICLLVICLALFLSGARAAKISFLGGLVLLFFLYLIFVPKKNYLRITGKVLLGGVLLAFLIAIFFLFQPSSIIQQKFIQVATKSRLVVWEKAWKGFLEKPILGWGPENFEYVFNKYFNPCMFLPECGGEIWFDRAHNIIFDTLVTTGIVGFLAYLGIFLSVFYILWKNYFQKKIDFWPAGIFSSLFISYSVQNLTVFDMISSYLMFFLVLGFIGSTTISREMLPQKFISPKIWPISLIKILFIFSFFYFIIQPLKTDYYVIAALKASPASEKRLNFYKKALESSPLGKYQIRDFFAQTTLELAQKIKEIPAENFKKECDFVIAELEKSIKEAPFDFRSHLTLGQLYNAYSVLIDQAKISKAERVLEKAIELSPTNQQGYWSLAQTRLYQRRFDEAIALAEKAISLEPKLFQSHRIVIQIAKIMGNKELAWQKVKRAIKINPQWEEELKNILED